ncbi:2-isopropylmalate synthase [Dethiobacter alkaliphilus]|uniref:2-isopropylmalate synthase n=1 Tax=Dethiobacter alkaliphilus TaxID=427926 RepID=UPI002227F169|nr:2-isopropylmalate synthase [Dethiobacter alkaliphilus]MCW3490704.1 2-isopropylmalate synthase [Dethiobacter alkaliphilus]
MTEKIMIFDSTLRDGEQTPGARLNRKEKLKIAKQLAKLNVDVIECGFPVSSPGEFKAVQSIAQQVKGPIITALARTIQGDIDAVWEAIKDAERPRIHTFLGSSDIHMKYKLQKDPQTLLEMGVEAVRYAKRYTADVQYSLEDATRSDLDYMCRVIEAVINAGATVINLPDTVGYAVPEEYGAMISNIMNRVPNIDKAIVSVHCHNDLGLAVANSLEAIKYGARQVECNINGIGERAGNAALEEIVTGLVIRKDYFQDYRTDVQLDEIYKTSRLVSNLTGIPIPVNKAVIGINAFAHSSGIHQDGVLKNLSTYEIINAELIGGKAAQMVLTARSGRHAVKNELQEMGFVLEEAEFAQFFEAFLELADKKKEVFREDLEALMADRLAYAAPTYSLEYLQTVSGSRSIPAAVVKLKKDDEIFVGTDCGAGPIDAAYNAIDKITGIEPRLETYNLRGVTEGRDALGEVSIMIQYQDKNIVGRGTSTDIIEASVRAYLNGVNKLLSICHMNGNGHTNGCGCDVK